MRQANKRGLLIAGAVLLSSTLLTAAPMAAENANEVRDVATFSALSLRGSMDADVKVGETQRVEIFADARDIEYIKTIVKGDELWVSVEKGHRQRGRVRLVVSVKDLNDVSVNGSGDIKASGIDSQNFGAEINGSGDIALSGKCGEGDYEINGSGDIEAEALKCGTVSVEINGSGDMNISAAEYITVEINGSGDVDIHGEPRLRRLSSNGSGDVRIKD